LTAVTLQLCADHSPDQATAAVVKLTKCWLHLQQLQSAQLARL
jgi:hypothetical protein